MRFSACQCAAGALFDAPGFELTKLKPEQAAYTRIPVEGPYKSDHYRHYGGSSAREGA
jgi:hypothetical protein